MRSKAWPASLRGHINGAGAGDLSRMRRRSASATWEERWTAEARFLVRVAAMMMNSARSVPHAPSPKLIFAAMVQSSSVFNPCLREFHHWVTLRHSEVKPSLTFDVCACHS